MEADETTTHPRADHKSQLAFCLISFGDQPARNNFRLGLLFHSCIDSTLFLFIFFYIPLLFLVILVLLLRLRVPSCFARLAKSWQGRKGRRKIIKIKVASPDEVACVGLFSSASLFLLFLALLLLGRRLLITRCYTVAGLL